MFNFKKKSRSKLFCIETLIEAEFINNEFINRILSIGVLVVIDLKLSSLPSLFVHRDLQLVVAMIILIKIQLI